ncbi:hypothetical protein BSLG_005321 [Batrachochytrium salamandrivorans]|nr:hypothetical protein BSLG_005321 [Batrachochytrium salamandrivorans]
MHFIFTTVVGTFLASAVAGAPQHPTDYTSESAPSTADYSTEPAYSDLTSTWTTTADVTAHTADVTAHTADVTAHTADVTAHTADAATHTADAATHTSSDPMTQPTPEGYGDESVTGSTTKHAGFSSTTTMWEQSSMPAYPTATPDQPQPYTWWETPSPMATPTPNSDSEYTKDHPSPHHTSSTPASTNDHTHPSLVTVNSAYNMNIHGAMAALVAGMVVLVGM